MVDIPRLTYPADPVKMKHAPAMVSAIRDELGPIKTMCDIGCGTGVYVQAMLDQGVEAMGIEGNPNAWNECKTDPSRLIRADLTDGPWPVPGVVDLMLSVEVAEHLPATAADHFAHQMGVHTRRWVLLTASPDPGRYHLNPQSKVYWIEMMQRYGSLLFDRKKTRSLTKWFKAIIPRKDGLVWFRRDVMVFQRKLQ